ncbi:Signal recognition particle receptor FtsY [Tessaracoccus sp. O5.2]|uniref:signal recognition particle-docking protein FtsY n=1 Tax=Tessaracoccus sp. O5.2 TaxID=3157622 RepID=UPI0035E9B80A
MEWFFWVIIAIVGLAILIAGIVVAVDRRRQLEHEERPELEPREPGGEVVVPPVTPEPAEPTYAEAVPPAGAPDVAAAPAAVIERPESATSRWARLRRRLAGSNNALARALADLLSVDRLDEETWDDFETTLITSDLGVGPTTELTGALRRRFAVDGVADPAEARRILHEELLALVDPHLDRSLNLTPSADGLPAVVLVVGVNGTGKTTTVGKLARVLVAEGRSVLLGAADTFRAAATEQLATWGERVGVHTVRGPEAGDPASVAFDAVAQGAAEGVDVVIVDTAGRLHTKTGLMDELGKVKRVIEKKAAVSEVLLVLDATTGQNGMTQARIFSEVVDVTGIVLTKLDGSAKGGIVIQVQRELGVPVKLVGLGEGPDDLAPFDPEGFVAGILGE